MHLSLLTLLRNLHRDESGQDLIEYALIAAVVGFGTVVAMQGLSQGINSAFEMISKTLANYITNAST